MRTALLAASLCFLFLSGCRTGPCADVKGTCVAFTAGKSTEDQIQTAVQTAQSGTTLAFSAGTFPFTNTVALFQQNNVTILGAGIDKTIFDFTNQAAGSDGVDASSGTGLVFSHFTIQNAKGNALKVLGSQNVVFDTVKTTWTTPNATTNGPYGIYPVQVQDLIIEHCVVTGASDSGIYVGQSQNAIVWDNEAFGNVAGIEIENTWGAEVSHNRSHDNTGGILVFDLPDLPQQGGHDVRVHDNQIISNNNPNFATNGDIVSQVPSGTGLLVMANHEVEVFDNTIQGNNSVGMAVTSYLVTQLPIPDAGYYPYSYGVYLHDNMVTESGNSPDPTVSIGLLLSAYQSSFPGGHVPDLIYDGAIDPVWAADAGTLDVNGGPNPNAMQICFHGNGGSPTFVDINFPALQYCGTDAGPDAGPIIGCENGGLTNFPAIEDQDITPFTCTEASTPQVKPGSLSVPSGVY
jgi:parallel beta-helix repeat protein